MIITFTKMCCRFFTTMTHYHMLIDKTRTLGGWKFLTQTYIWKKIWFFFKIFKTMVIAYLRQTLFDFQNLSLFRKLMKILINLKCGRTATQPLSLVPLPLKILFNFIYLVWFYHLISLILWLNFSKLTLLF